MPPVRQRLVRRHPGSGRKTLYLASHASHIVDWPVPDGMLLMRELIEHATRLEFVYRHRWRVGDLVIWDNRCTMHGAGRSTRPSRATCAGSRRRTPPRRSIRRRRTGRVPPRLLVAASDDTRLFHCEPTGLAFGQPEVNSAKQFDAITRIGLRQEETWTSGEGRGDFASVSRAASDRHPAARADARRSRRGLSGPRRVRGDRNAARPRRRRRVQDRADDADHAVSVRRRRAVLRRDLRERGASPPRRAGNARLLPARDRDRDRGAARRGPAARRRCRAGRSGGRKRYGGDRAARGFAARL